MTHWGVTVTNRLNLANPLDIMESAGIYLHITGSIFFTSELFKICSVCEGVCVCVCSAVLKENLIDGNL